MAKKGKKKTTSAPRAKTSSGRKSTPARKKGVSKKSPEKPTSNIDKAGLKNALEDSNSIQGKINQLAEAVVFTEPSDPKALADLHTQLEAVGQLLSESSKQNAAEAVKITLQLLEKVILEEAQDPDAVMEVIGQTVSILQSIILEGRGDEEVDFPPDLGLEVRKSEERILEETANEVEGVEQSRSFVLAASVDKAIFEEFVSRQGGVLEDLEALILELEKSYNEEKFRELRRIIHTLKGEAALLELLDVEKLCHLTEDLLDTQPSGQLTDLLLLVKDWLDRKFDFCSGSGSEPEAVDSILRQLDIALPKVEEELAAFEEEFKSIEEEGTDFSLLENDPQLLADFISESRDHLESADLHLLTLETEPEQAEALNAVFRAFHTIKGVAGFLSLEEIGMLSHEAENLLDRARKGELTLGGEAIDVTFEAVDMLKKLVGYLSQSLSSGEPLASERTLPKLLARISSIASGQVVIGPGETASKIDGKGKRVGELLVEAGVVGREDVEAALKKQESSPDKKRLGEILVSSSMSSKKRVDRALDHQREGIERGKLGEIMVKAGTALPEDVDSALDAQFNEPRKPKIGELLVQDGKASAKDVAMALRSQKGSALQQTFQVKETLKVDAERLDRLVDTIGEMVIAESMVSQSPEIKRFASNNLFRHIRQMDKITRELQELGTSLRMVPVRSTFQKMARLVRDLSKKAGKRIEFVAAGEDTELDKTVVDRIGDPLVHLVRNAVDHGIEDSPEDRLKAGKLAVGKIELRAFHKGGSIYIEIEDDGRGIDRDVILAKAKERGLVKEIDSLTDRDALNLVFEPGFSTAKKVTDVSGRGVGMDVVKRNIEALRGQTEIRSEKGKGSVFSMRLPLTLAIIDGMVVTVGEERFIIPTLSIVRSIRPQESDIKTVFDRGEMFLMQGQLIPLFRLSELFLVEGAKRDPAEALVVVVEDDGLLTGIMTDGLLGQLQIVIKSLGEAMKDTPGISGGAIMPDGQVGLILDVGGLVKLAHSDERSLQNMDLEILGRSDIESEATDLGRGEQEKPGAPGNQETD